MMSETLLMVGPRGFKRFKGTGNCWGREGGYKSREKEKELNDNPQLQG
jgi:hypothetical protein